MDEISADSPSHRRPLTAPRKSIFRVEPKFPAGSPPGPFLHSGGNVVTLLKLLCGEGSRQAANSSFLPHNPLRGTPSLRALQQREAMHPKSGIHRRRKWWLKQRQLQEEGFLIQPGKLQQGKLQVLDNPPPGPKPRIAGWLLGLFCNHHSKSEGNLSNYRTWHTNTFLKANLQDWTFPCHLSS